MADRSSAKAYGICFEILAQFREQGTAFAQTLFATMLCERLDFSLYQMYADEALIKLGLCRKSTEKEQGTHGECIYFNDEIF